MALTGQLHTPMQLWHLMQDMLEVCLLHDYSCVISLHDVAIKKCQVWGSMQINY